MNILASLFANKKPQPRALKKILCSADNDAIYYRKLGASGVISKPIAPPQLCEKVASIWRVLQAGGKA